MVTKTLSDKSKCSCLSTTEGEFACKKGKPTYFHIEDVKEFIQELKEKTFGMDIQLFEIIDKLAGDKLT